MADKKTPETPESPESIKEEVETAASEKGAGATVAEGDRGDERSGAEVVSEGAAAEAPAPAKAAPAEAKAPAPAKAAAPAPAQTPAPAAATPEAVLSPKERRVRRRAAKTPASRGPLTPEQRDEERRALRVKRAKVRRTYRARLKAKAAGRRAAAPPTEPAHAPEHGPGRAKVRQGIVVSDKADKTIVVRVDVTRRHRRYGKIMRTSSKLHVHDERNDAGTGDTVRVIECRPMSRSKRWRLTDVLEKAK
jgi:small subunit ribosomal protein S17